MCRRQFQTINLMMTHVRIGHVAHDLDTKAVQSEQNDDLGHYPNVEFDISSMRWPNHKNVF